MSVIIVYEHDCPKAQISAEQPFPLSKVRDMKEPMLCEKCGIQYDILDVYVDGEPTDDEATLLRHLDRWKEFDTSVGGKASKELTYALLKAVRDLNQEIADRLELEKYEAELSRMDLKTLAKEALDAAGDSVSGLFSSLGSSRARVSKKHLMEKIDQLSGAFQRKNDPEYVQCADCQRMFNKDFTDPSKPSLCPECRR